MLSCNVTAERGKENNATSREFNPLLMPRREKRVSLPERVSKTHEEQEEEERKQNFIKRKVKLFA
jgi:hypothetical protein